ncbi:hypothetical protein FHT29_005787 [Rhizobium sp. SG741]|nr:hypothetical protein [Rhizobium sp. SG741]
MGGFRCANAVLLWIIEAYLLSVRSLPGIVGDISFSAIRRMEISTAKDRNEAPAPVRQAFELQGICFLRGGKGRISVGLGVNHSHDWDGFFHTPANDYDGLAARAGCASGSILIWSRPFILAA